MKKMKTILLAALLLVGGYVQAQVVNIVLTNSQLPYTIRNTSDASGATGLEYQWLEDGYIIPAEVGPTLVLPAKHAAGTFTYIRQVRSASCSDWQSSNAFTVQFNTSEGDMQYFNPSAGLAVGTEYILTDNRDGKTYRVVKLNNGKWWMVSNLAYGGTLDKCAGRAFYSQPLAEYPAPDMHIDGSEPGCVGKDLRLNQGYLYEWRTALNQTGARSSWPSYNQTSQVQGVCPYGWHVANRADIGNIYRPIETNGTTYLDYWKASNALNLDGGTTSGDNKRTRGRFMSLKRDRIWLPSGYVSSKETAAMINLPARCGIGFNNDIKDSNGRSESINDDLRRGRQSECLKNEKGVGMYERTATAGDMYWDYHHVRCVKNY